MIDIKTESLLSITDTTKRLPLVDGKRCHCSSVWRWIRKGLRGVHLEHVRVGHRICTSEEALTRFFNALAEADASPSPSLNKPASSALLPDKHRVLAIERADQVLVKAGLK